MTIQEWVESNICERDGYGHGPDDERGFGTGYGNGIGAGKGDSDRYGNGHGHGILGNYGFGRASGAGCEDGRCFIGDE